jgi:hypothetical protein
MAVSDDSEFKNALTGLSLARQRQVAVRFVESVLALCKDPRVVGAVKAAAEAEITEAERATHYQAARSAAVESYTQCGREADWLCQAGHFVAEAAMASFKPADQAGNLAWEAAMHARMARNCEAIFTGEPSATLEAHQQYRILSEYLNQ